MWRDLTVCGIGGGWYRRLAAVVAAALGLACQAPMQRVPLHVEPGGARIFVDGIPLDGNPDAVELRSDRPHVIHVERDGYRAEQMVLEVRDGEAGAPGMQLEPSEIRLRLEPLVPKDSEVRIEGFDS